MEEEEKEKVANLKILNETIKVRQSKPNQKAWVVVYVSTQCAKLLGVGQWSFIAWRWRRRLRRERDWRAAVRGSSSSLKVKSAIYWPKRGAPLLSLQNNCFRVQVEAVKRVCSSSLCFRKSLSSPVGKSFFYLFLDSKVTHVFPLYFLRINNHFCLGKLCESILIGGWACWRLWYIFSCLFSWLFLYSKHVYYYYIILWYYVAIFYLFFGLPDDHLNSNEF